MSGFLVNVGSLMASQKPLFRPFKDVAGMKFGFEARNQGVANAATTGAITDESGGGRNLSAENSTTFTYSAASKCFVKTNTSACMSDIAGGGFYGAAVTVILVGRYVSGTGAFASLVSSSAYFDISSNTAFRWRNNQAGGLVTAAGTYDLTLPFMATLRITDAANAKIRVNDQADTVFDPNNTYITNTFFKLGSLNGTTAGLMAEYYAAYTFDRVLTDVEVAQFYAYARRNFS